MEHFEKWWVIYAGLIASVGTILLGVVDNKGFPSEEYISAAAFLMLISTAILQNRSLSKQHEEVKLNRQSLDKQVNALEQQIEEVKLNRKSLELQAEEMGNHTKEFQESNEKSNESLEMQKFFELLKLKEDLYSQIIKEKDTFGFNRLQTFNKYSFISFKAEAIKEIFIEFEEQIKKEGLDYYTTLNNHQISTLYNGLSLDERTRFIKVVNDSINYTYIRKEFVDEIDRALIKLYSYHVLLKGMVMEGTSGIYGLIAAQGKVFEEVSARMNEMWYGKEKEPKTIKEIYHGLITEDERTLYTILGKKLNAHILFEIEDAD